jgi:hypothetical protein
MKSKVLYIFLFLISILVASAIGFYAGSRLTQQKLARYFQHLDFVSYGNELKLEVKLLELLRKKENQKAEQFLEKFMDVNLASLSIYGNTPPTERNEEIITAIKPAKDYRKRHPGHQVSPTLSESVQRAMDLAE